MAQPRISHKGRSIPVIAFWGTQGGVGKTTIARKFAELVTLADASPNVLLVDVDVHNRGMTGDVTKNIPVNIKTVHDYIASRNYAQVETLDISHLVEGRRPGSGRLTFIPASMPEAKNVFDESAKIGAGNLLEILAGMIQLAVDQGDCQCVVIDCGACIDTYTSSGVMLSDRAFLVGRNQPTTYENSRIYPGRVREMHPEFNSGKVKLIINMVHQQEILNERMRMNDVFHAIPFTKAIVDASEGLTSGEQMVSMMFYSHIRQIIEESLRHDHPELVPPAHSVLPDEWIHLAEKTDAIQSSGALRRLGRLRMLWPLGFLGCVAAGFVFYDASSERHVEENRALVVDLRKGIEERLTDGGGKAADDAKLREIATGLDKLALDDDEGLKKFSGEAGAAGVTPLPVVKTLPADKENRGIIVLISSALVSMLGLACGGRRNHYLAAIQGLRRGGPEWMMSQLATRSSMRRTFDRLVRIAKSC